MNASRLLMISVAAALTILACLPIVAGLINMGVWAFTGHTPFPWISHWLADTGNES